MAFADVNMVATEIGNLWKTLSISLGLDLRLIEDVERYGNAPNKDKALLALSKWQERKGKEANKEALIEALDVTKRKDIADQLRAM